MFQLCVCVLYFVEQCGNSWGSEPHYMLGLSDAMSSGCVQVCVFE